MALCSLLVLGVVCGLLTANDLLLSTRRSWNDARLAPAAALIRGYGLYDDPEGPLLGNAYGPFFPVVFVPAALLPTPSAAIYGGVIVNLLLYLVPALLLLWIAGGRRWVLVGAAWACFVLYTFKTPVLTGPAFWIHADAPALGFAALSCALLYDRRRRERSTHLLGAALLATVAIGTKQVLLPLVVATPAFLWLTAGWRTSRRYLGYLTISAMAVLATLALFTDMRSMVFNAIVVPSRHPLKAEGALLDALVELARRSLVPTAIVAVVLGLEILHARASGESLRQRARDSGWLLPLLVAIACVPISVASRARAGGAWNTMAPTLYFLLLAALMGLLSVARRRWEPMVRFQPVALVTWALLLGAAALAIANGPRLSLLPQTIAHLERDPERAAYEFVRARPGQVYLPFRPLVSLMAEGRAYHFSWGVRSYDLAGIPIDEGRLRANLPADLRTVITNRRLPVYVLRYLPEYSVDVGHPELPGWRVLTVPEPGRSGAR